LHQGFFVTSFGGVPKQKLCREEDGYQAAVTALARLMVKQADVQANSSVPTWVNPKAAKGIAAESEKTLADVFNEFLALKKVEVDPRTFTFYCECLTPLFARLGDRPIRSITLTDGSRYKSWLMNEKPWKKGKKVMRGLGPTAVNHRIRCAKMLLGWAARPSRRYIDFNPWEEIGYLPEKGRERIISQTEFDHLYRNAVSEELKDILLVLRNTTLRPGELRKLRANYIHWDRHVIVFPPEVIKTRNRRQVTMNEVAEEVLRRRAGRGYVFRGGDRSDPEQPMNDQVFSRRFNRLVQKCVKLGLIQQEKSGERLVCYSTRHSAISSLVMAGLPLKSVMDEAGHLNPATTQRYTHLVDGFTTDLVRQVPATLPPSESSPSGKDEQTG
jgi:integrase